LASRVGLTRLAKVSPRRQAPNKIVRDTKFFLELPLF